MTRVQVRANRRWSRKLAPWRRCVGGDGEARAPTRGTGFSGDGMSTAVNRRCVLTRPLFWGPATQKKVDDRGWGRPTPHGTGGKLGSTSLIPQIVLHTKGFLR